MRAELAFRCEATLGEGASWDVARGRLWWVDILGRAVFCGDPATGALRSWPMATEVGAALSAADGRRALVLRDRVALFDPETGALEEVWRGDEPAHNRFNDAGTDRSGNLWIGSMDFDAVEATGQIWRVTPGGTGRAVHGGYRCLNGPVFSPDGRTLYFCDTGEGRVFAAPHDPATGDLGAIRLFVDLGRTGGLSDGMAVDADGCVWLARITAGRVTRFAPSGEPVLTIPVPVPMPTSCTFGDGDLGTLYITTARILMTDVDLAAYPDSGSVYAVRPGVSGIAPTPFGG